MNLLPIGSIGELFIGGIGVARGYLNREDLTKERFLPNPYQREEEKKRGNKNGRIYKTGDLVRWLISSDGELEYLGRNDFQVKIRGLRIELSEIESVLSKYKGIKQCVVIARELNERKYLLAYYVSDSIENELDIKEFIQTKLPDYMIPNRLIRIEKMPITTNGKLDTKALPQVDLTKMR